MKVRLCYLRHQPLGVGLVLQNDSSFQMGFYFLANKGFVKIVNQYDLGEYNFVRCWLQVQDHFLKTCHGHNNTHLTIYGGRKLYECNYPCGLANTRVLFVGY